MQTEVDVLIIGAGPAGSSAAALLHKQGFKLLVVEKQIFPRFVIGESLLPHCMDLLKEAELLDAVEAQGFIHKCGAVFLRGDETCNFDFSDQFTAGWKYTFQVPRADFDKTLADTVAARGVEIFYGHGVTAISFNKDGAVVTIEPPDKSVRKISARFVLDCSGYGRVLPRLLDLEKPTSFPTREALFTRTSPATGVRVRARRWKNLGVHPSGGRMDLDHSVFQWQDQHGRRGHAGIFPKISRRTGRATPRNSDGRLRCRRAAWRNEIYFSRRDASAVMRARSNSFTAHISRSPETPRNFSIPFSVPASRLRSHRRIARPKPSRASCAAKRWTGRPITPTMSCRASIRFARMFWRGMMGRCRTFFLPPNPTRMSCGRSVPCWRVTSGTSRTPTSRSRNAPCPCSRKL